MHAVSVATLDSFMLCYPEQMTVYLKITPAAIQLTGNSSTIAYVKSEALQEALGRLNSTMQNPVMTYIGGIPGRASDKKGGLF